MTDAEKTFQHAPGVRFLRIPAPPKQEGRVMPSSKDFPEFFSPRPGISSSSPKKNAERFFQLSLNRPSKHFMGKDAKKIATS
jgi:hypothetical protein